ncbi:DnaB-like helicase C-terminal domain-containing protein [Streptomyces microflavus]|uniref:DnaB-like helicase C-terminal domain-containing protein n=1 Tax=Streptomyces microflavus TaxID=1919 RepID=UPI00382606A4
MSNRTGIMTGLSDFDAFAGPLPRGQVTAAVGRTSAGMTAFALSVARHNDEIGHHVAFASFEDGTDTVMGNFLAAHTSVNVDRPRSINPGRRARIDRARAAIERSNLLMWSEAQRPGRPFENLME